MNLRRWIHRLRRRRNIEVTTSGKWFLTLTIVFGVAAVLSGNGVLYLLESLLLGFLILSGVLSDRMLWNLRAQWIESPVHASGALTDRISVTNQSWIPAIAVEFGEWTDRGFEVRGYLPLLRGRTRVEIKLLDRPYPKRGLFGWTGRVMATRFPFGFARKIRWIGAEGERWIRPALHPSQTDSTESSAAGAWGPDEIEDGSVRSHLTGDDPRDIAWIYSNSLIGPHLQRVRSGLPEPVKLKLECEGLDFSALESHLSEIATELVRAKKKGAPIELHDPREGGRDFDDAELALEWLARIPAAKPRAPSR